MFSAVYGGKRSRPRKSNRSGSWPWHRGRVDARSIREREHSPNPVFIPWRYQDGHLRSSHERIAEDNSGYGLRPTCNPRCDVEGSGELMPVFPISFAECLPIMALTSTDFGTDFDTEVSK